MIDASINKNSDENASPQLLREVKYLASLVSDSHDIDPILDKIQVATVNIDTSGKLDAHSEMGLISVRDELRQYLTKQDPARSFSPEELEQKVHEYFHPSGIRQRTRRAFIAIWCISFALYALMFALPLSLSVDVRGQVGAFMLLFTLGVGAAWFFMGASREFKPELKQAFSYMSFGALTIGLGHFQLPVMGLFDLGQAPLFKYGGFMAPFTIGMLLIYLGLRRYALVVGVKTRATSLVVAIGGMIFTSLLVMAIPHYRYFLPGQEVYFNLSVESLAPQAYINAVALWLAYRIIVSTTQIYGKAFKYLCVMLAFSLIGTIEFMTAIFIFGELYGTRQLVAAIPYVLTALFLFQSGYAFRKVSRY